MYLGAQTSWAEVVDVAAIKHSVVEGLVVAQPSGSACNANDAATFFEDTVIETGAPPA